MAGRVKGADAAVRNCEFSSSTRLALFGRAVKRNEEFLRVRVGVV